MQCTLATILPKLIEPESLPEVQELEEFSVSVNQLKNIAAREAKATARAHQGLEALELALDCFKDVKAWHLAKCEEDVEAEHGRPACIQDLAFESHKLEDLSL